MPMLQFRDFNREKRIIVSSGGIKLIVPTLQLFRRNHRTYNSRLQSGIHAKFKMVSSTGPDPGYDQIL